MDYIKGNKMHNGQEKAFRAGLNLDLQFAVAKVLIIAQSITIFSTRRLILSFFSPQASPAHLYFYICLVDRCRHHSPGNNHSTFFRA